MAQLKKSVNAKIMLVQSKGGLQLLFINNKPIEITKEQSEQLQKYLNLEIEIHD